MLYLLASIYTIGSLVGSLTCGIWSSLLGRKKVMIIANLLSGSGFLFVRFANNVELLYFGRLVGGLSFGLCFANIPPYTGEISQSRVRKFTATFMQTFYNAGFVTTFGLTTFLDWRTAIWILLCFPCINILTISIIPESPTWLMIKNKENESMTALNSLRGNKLIALQEMKRIKQNVNKQKELSMNDNNSSFIKNKLNILCKGTFIRPFLVVTTLLTLCWHLTGGIVLGFYAIDILEGIKIPMDTYWAAFMIACFQLFSAIVANIISSVLPRRKLFIGCGILEVIGTLILGTMVYLYRQEYFVEFIKDYSFIKWIPMVGILCFYGGYFGGYVTVTFILMGELLPSNARSIGSSMASACSILSMFLVVKFIPVLKESIGLDGCFWFFSGATFCSLIFCYVFVPETFGKTLESIEDHYREICYGSKICPKTSHFNPVFTHPDDSNCITKL